MEWINLTRGFYEAASLPDQDLTQGARDSLRAPQAMGSMEGGGCVCGGEREELT